MTGDGTDYGHCILLTERKPSVSVEKGFTCMKL